jgi:hypothetical protein
VVPPGAAIALRWVREHRLCNEEHPAITIDSA